MNAYQKIVQLASNQLKKELSSTQPIEEYIEMVLLTSVLNGIEYTETILFLARPCEDDFINMSRELIDTLISCCKEPILINEAGMDDVEILRRTNIILRESFDVIAQNCVKLKYEIQ